MKKKQKIKTHTHTHIHHHKHMHITHSKHIISIHKHIMVVMDICTNWSNNTRITDYWNFLKKTYPIYNYGLRITDMLFSEIYSIWKTYIWFHRTMFFWTSFWYPTILPLLSLYIVSYICIIKHKWSVYIVYMLDMFLSEIRLCFY